MRIIGFKYFEHLESFDEGDRVPGDQDASSHS